MRQPAVLDQLVAVLTEACKEGSDGFQNWVGIAFNTSDVDVVSEVKIHVVRIVHRSNGLQELILERTDGTKTADVDGVFEVEPWSKTCLDLVIVRQVQQLFSRELGAIGSCEDFVEIKEGSLGVGREVDILTA